MRLSCKLCDWCTVLLVCLYLRLSRATFVSCGARIGAPETCEVGRQRVTHDRHISMLYIKPSLVGTD